MYNTWCQTYNFDCKIAYVMSVRHFSRNSSLGAKQLFIPEIVILILVNNRIIYNICKLNLSSYGPELRIKQAVVLRLYYSIDF